MRVEQQARVPSLRREDLAREHLHQVRLAHAGRREDADVRGERLAADPDLEVDRVLARAQQADPHVAHPLAQEVEVLGGRRRHPRELRRERLRLAERARGVDVAERLARRDLVQALLGVVERVLGPGDVAGHVRAGRALGPGRVGRVRAVRHLDHAEEEPAGRARDPRRRAARRGTGPCRRTSGRSTRARSCRRSGPCTRSSVQHLVEVLEQQLDVVLRPSRGARARRGTSAGRRRRRSP